MNQTEIFQQLESSSISSSSGGGSLFSSNTAAATSSFQPVVAHNLSSYLPPSRFGSALGASVAFLFIVFGVLGDTLIILAILSKRELRRNIVNIFIVSLQLNDLFNICFNQFLVGLSYLFMKWHGPYIICELFVYTSIICTGTLLWHHALIAIHRYLVVVCNLNINHFKRAPKFYALFSIVAARLIPSLVCVPALYSRNMTVYSPAALRCMLAPGVSALQNLLIVLINMLVPCLIVIFCFAAIFARVRSVSKNVQMAAGSKMSKSSNGAGCGERNGAGGKSWSPQMSSSLAGRNKQKKKKKEKSSNYSAAGGLSNPNTPRASTANGGQTQGGGGGGGKAMSRASTYTGTFTMSLASMHREIQISKMFAIIFTVFLFGYLPYGIIRLIDKNNSLNPDVYVMLTVLFIISISVSPIIYGLMNKQIKVQCVVLLRQLVGLDSGNRRFGDAGFTQQNYTTYINNNNNNNNEVNANRFGENFSIASNARLNATCTTPSPKLRATAAAAGSIKRAPIATSPVVDIDSIDNQDDLLPQPVELPFSNNNKSSPVADDPLLSSSLPLLNGHVELKTGENGSPQQSQDATEPHPVGTNRKKSNSISQRFINLFMPTSTSSKNGVEVDKSSESDREMEAAVAAEFNERLVVGIATDDEPELNQSKLLILAQDDGGVYKGPPVLAT